MVDDRRTRATVPPAQAPPRPSSRGEDSPPMARPPRDLRDHEALSRQALAAPRVNDDADREVVLRALAASDAKKSAELDEFEEGIRAQIQALVIKEVKHTVPPPSTKAPAAEPYAWLKHVPAILMAVSALIISVTQSCAKKAEVNADMSAKIVALETRLTAHVTSSDKKDAAFSDDLSATFQAELAEHCFLSAVLEKLDVKVDHPEVPGMKCPVIEFYAPPHKKTPGTHQIQPNSTFPWPAKP